MDCHSFPSPVDHVLSEISTMTHPSWVALHGMAHSFIELDKAVFPVIRKKKKEKEMQKIQEKMQKKCKKAKWLSEEALQMAMKRREVKNK